MIVSRIPARLGKLMSSAITSWYSGLAPILHTPCRAIATGRVHKRQEVSSEFIQDVALLDPFLGRWKEIGRENMEAFLVITGIPEDIQEIILSKKSELIYSRNYDIWTQKSGPVGSPDSEKIESEFKLGESFDYEFAGMIPAEGVIYQDGKKLKEKYVTTVRPYWAQTIVGEVSGDELTRTLTRHGVTMKKIFRRSP